MPEQRISVQFLVGKESCTALAGFSHCDQDIEFKVHGLVANLELQIAESGSERDQGLQAGDSS